MQMLSLAQGLSGLLLFPLAKQPCSLKGVSLGQGGSPLAAELELGLKLEQLKLSPLAQSVHHTDLQPGRRYSCSGICPILWGTKSPEDSENHPGDSVCAAASGTMAVLGPGFLSESVAL